MDGVADLLCTYTDLDAENLFRALKALKKINLDFRICSKNITIAMGTVVGTTASGHPVRTTLFNTLRVILYYKFICYRAGIPIGAYYLIVSGDDVFSFM